MRRHIGRAGDLAKVAALATPAAMAIGFGGGRQARRRRRAVTAIARAAAIALAAILGIALPLALALPAAATPCLPAACATPAANAALGGAPLVRAEGRRLVHPDGSPLALRGINLGNWLLPEGYIFKLKLAKSPRKIDAGIVRLLGAADARAFWRRFRDAYITRDDIFLIRAVGFNFVRLPMHYGLLMQDGRPDPDAEGFARIDQLVRWCKDAGLYLILDLHAAPGGQAGGNHDDSSYPLLYYVPRHQRATIALWQTIAARYRGEPTILGYDLLNEPIAPFHDTGLLNDRLEPLYRRIVAAIRAEDPERLIFLGGAQWNGNFEVFGPPFADNLGYTYHQFWSRTTRDSIQPLLQFRDRHNVPFWLGESGELTNTWNRAFRTLNERHGIGWSFWTYKNFDTGSTVVSCPLPADWEPIAAFIDASTRPFADPPPPERALVDKAMATLVDYVRLRNCTIRWGYLDSLGLPGPPPAQTASR